MAHCAWCGYDLYKKDAVELMHAECVPKRDRRRDLEEVMLLVVRLQGIDTPRRNNLLTDLCFRIEKALDGKDGP